MYVCMYVYVYKAAQRNFIESMAAYAVVCYLLKVSVCLCLCVCEREREREHGVVCYLLKVSCLSLLTISQGSKQALLRLYAGSIKGCVCHGVVAVEGVVRQVFEAGM